MFSYVARVVRDDKFEPMVLYVYRDAHRVSTRDGDELVTVTFETDPFDRPPHPGKDS